MSLTHVQLSEQQLWLSKTACQGLDLWWEVKTNKEPQKTPRLWAELTQNYVMKDAVKVLTKVNIGHWPG